MQGEQQHYDSIIRGQESNCKIDMSPNQELGICIRLRFKDLLPRGNIKEYETTYRIGSPMAELLRPVEPGFVSLAKHCTTYEVHYLLPDEDFDQILPLVVQTRPNL